MKRFTVDYMNTLILEEDEQIAMHGSDSVWKMEQYLEQRMGRFESRMHLISLNI